MKQVKIIFFCSFLVTLIHAQPTDYPASLFGIRGDGVSLNTRSIQFAIDFISRAGGGRLVFNVGNFLSGSIHLRSNVTLELESGAVITGSLNPLDYDKDIFTALILADNQENIAITGKGMIDGRGRGVVTNLIYLIHEGIIKDPLRNDRPGEAIRPMLIDFRGCRHVRIKNITLKDAASWVQTYDQCKDVSVDSVTVDSKSYWNNDGIDIVDCDSVMVEHSYIDAADDGICLKSHDPTKTCQHILIEHNRIRSSASGIKFGTASYGGFSHIRILDNDVFDTYRSALALEAVDGGFIEDVTVDALRAARVGNAVFMRIGARVAGKISRLEQVKISNVEIEIAPGKADSGYSFEGPVEDQPRNISPAIIITGLPDAMISSIAISNIHINFPGGANPLYAKALPAEIDKIPEKPSAYPEFSMFGELPAWGLFIRHAKNISITHLQLTCSKKDYRVPVVLDDVHDLQLNFAGPKMSKNKASVFSSRSASITIE
jgi:Glycosyl hydrolases family 28